jgi:nitrite reductase (NADH) large subunit
MSNKQTIVVVGNGMVGQNFLVSLMESDLKDKFNVVTFCEEPIAAYDRVHLSEYFAGKSADDLSLVELGFFENNDITVHMADKVVSIDREAKTVTSEKGKQIAYDKLVLAMGSTAFVPPIPGNDREQCIPYRTIADLDEMKIAATKSKVGVVVGGGLLGLEASKALKDLNLKTVVVQFSPRLMSAQLDDGGADLLKKKIEALNIDVLTNKNTIRIEDGTTCKHKMVFADGSELETDMIVYSAGIRPRDELAIAAGIKVAPRGGVVIDDACLTSDPNIYAIGECASWNDQIFGLVAPGYAMARTVVNRLGGGEALFQGADMSTKLKLNGVDVASIGDPHGTTPGSLLYTYQMVLTVSIRALLLAQIIKNYSVRCL